MAQAKNTRRDFLKTASAVAAAGALAVQRGAHAAGDDVIKVGLIGCGGRGSGAAAQALAADPGARLIAMADIFEDKVLASRENLKKRSPEQVAVDDDHCFVGFDGYRKVIDSGPDVVLIACASRFHPPYMKAVIDAGKHVFVEKPHAIDPPGIRVVTAAAEEARKKSLNCVSGLHFRPQPNVHETAMRIRDGAIGQIVSMEVNYMRAPYRIIKRDPALSELEWQYRNWYHFNWLSGDDVPQSLVHTVDRAAWVMHEEPPVKGHGLGGRAAFPGPQLGNCFDHHALCWEFANGVSMYGFNRTQYNCLGGAGDKIFGTKGRASMSGGWIDGETKWKFSGPRGDGHAIEQQKLMAAIRAGETINDGVHMARSTLITILGQMACYTGKQWTWEQVSKSDYTYPPDKVDFDIDPPVVPDEEGNYPVAVPGMTELS